MSLLRTFVRRTLARWGYELTKSEQNPAPSVEAYLRELCRLESSDLCAICLDNELSIQTQLLNVFSEARVTFASPASSEAGVSGELKQPSQGFVVVVDIDGLPFSQWEKKYPWLKSARAILVCSRFGSFWAGHQDLARLAVALRPWSFSLRDVLGSTKLSPLQGSAELVVLAFERNDATRSTQQSCRFRALEALTYLSAPIVRRDDFQVIAGRGAAGFTGGVLNPGGIVENERLVLLARGERFAWATQKGDESKLLASSQPVVIHRTGAEAPFQIEVLPQHAPTGATAARTEDYRLFRFRGRIYSNHAVMSGPEPTPRAGQPVQLERMTSRIGLSRLTPDPAKLEWIGYPDLGIPLGRVEKNWAMFSEDDRLFLLYSMSPYRLFECKDWDALRFAPVVNEALPTFLDEDGLGIRNSVNPVPYDSDHWLHVVHRVYPNKQYSYWAVLIHRKTLRPVRVSARPLLHGGASYPTSIIYLCAVMAGPEEVTIAAGLDDAASAIATFPRTRLDQEWVPFS